MYFKGCSANSIWNYFDTSITVQSTFPYDLMIFTYRDTNTATTVPQPCFLTNLNIIPVDTFYLSTAQRLSTRESCRAPSFQVHPNPVDDRLYFNEGTPWHTMEAYISSVSKVMDARHGAHGAQIRVGQLPSGIYTMRLYGHGGSAQECEVCQVTLGEAPIF